MTYTPISRLPKCGRDRECIHIVHSSVPQNAVRLYVYTAVCGNYKQLSPFYAGTWHTRQNQNCKVCCLCCTMRILCATIITGLCMLDLRQTYGAAWVAELEDSLVQRRSWVWVSSRVAFIEKGCSWTVFFCTRLGWTVHNNDCICKCVRVHAWGGHSDVFGIKCRYCSLKFAGQKRQFNHVPKRLPTLPLCTLGRPNTPSGWIHTSWQRSAIIKFKKHKEKRRRRRSQFSRASVGDTCILHIANYSVTWLGLWPPIPLAMCVHTRTH